MTHRPLRSFVVFVVLLGWLCAAGFAPAQTGSLKHSPSDVVKRYVELDHKGARLDAMSADTIAAYTGWNEEPAWGHVVVTRGFVVAEQYRQWELVNSLEVVIPVTFQVIGSVYLATAGFVQDVETEEIRFRVKAVMNRWKIIEPILPPHVGHKRMVNFVREALANETDPARRERLGLLQEELRKAK